MLRRSGRFQRQKDVLFTPQEDDAGDDLEEKWQAWVEAESWKRLALHAFLVDAQVSMAFLTPPVISFTEVSLSLPAHEDVWWAKTAEEWKTAFLRRAPGQETSLVDHLREPQELPSCCDAPFSSLVILHGLWGMVFPHLQLRSVWTRQGRPHSAAMTLAHQELIQSLGDLRTNILDTEEKTCPRSTLVLELMLMRLHVSLEDIELFAGRGSQEQAREALPKLQQWAETREARQAIWHAGQVLRAAALFEHGQMCGFYPIAVFHASLAMWAYSVVSGIKRSSGESTCSNSVSLDGSDCSAVQRFITLGKGTPCIGAPYLAPLSDSEAAMGVVQSVLRGGQHDEQVLGQPLVQNVVQLLGDIGKAAANLKGDVGGVGVLPG